MQGQQPQPWFLRSATHFHASIALTLVLPAAALYLIVRNAATLELERNARDSERVASTLIGDAVSAQVLGLAQQVRGHALSVRLRDALAGRDRQGVETILSQLAGENTGQSRSLLTDPSGVVIANFPRDPAAMRADFSQRDWYRGVKLTGETYVSRAGQEAGSQAAIVVDIAHVVRGEDGNVAGYLVSQFAVRDLFKWVSSVKRPEKGSFLLLDQGGSLLSTAGATGEVLTPQLDGAIRRLLASGGGWARAPAPLTGRRSVVVVHRIEPLGWSVIGSIPDDIVFAGTNPISQGVIGLFLVALISSIWMGARWRRTLLRYDRRREAAEDDLQKAYENLEQMVRNRTQELQEANEALRREMEERTRAEEQLLHLQKLESIGRLAGGIAHDFNNHLTPILGFASLIEATLPEGDPNKDFARNIARAAERAALLTKQLLSIARKQVIQPIPFAVNEVIRETEAMLRRTVGEDIELTVRLQEAVWPIMMDPGQFEQILLNLVVNARDAMPSGGTLTISTINVELTEEDALSHPDVRPGSYVMLEVSDTGVGMDPETLAHVFEPFFTTKERGTGLGLAMTYGIVKQLGGYAWAFSERDKGSTFQIYFPRTEDTSEELESEREALGSPPGHESVLVVEDEEQVRAFIALVLRGVGYSVAECESSEEAIAMATAPGTKFDLLITDVVLPKFSGVDLARRIAGVFPGLKVLYMSGYSKNPAERRGDLGEGASYLAKPFTPTELLRKVRQVLDARDGGPPGTPTT